ncbi:hypothetical protein IKE67_08150 [bacterium]|nr:hypothetical protein [bacterium]
MISGFSNERVSYRTRYLNFPSTLTESTPSISKPTVHVIKIRFNNIFRNEKALFIAISVSLSLLSLAVGYGLYSVYNDITSDEMVSGANTVAIEQLKSISAEDTGATVMQKSAFGTSGASQQGGNYLSYNDGGGIDPNSMLIASGNNDSNKGKEALTSKKAVVDVDEKVSVNPFLPITDIQKTSVKKVVKVDPNNILPPTSVGYNSTANILLKTSVSGIMYDTYNPSAIIKIDNTDYLVRKGDEINGYKVLNIQPKTVTLKLGANIYEAPVGIILASLSTTNNTNVVNLNKRFAGSGGR